MENISEREKKKKKGQKKSLPNKGSTLTWTDVLQQVDK
jgi:hypothetical protein